MEFIHPLGFMFGISLFAYGIFTKFYGSGLPQEDYQVDVKDKKIKNWISEIFRTINTAHVIVTLLLLTIGVANLKIDRHLDSFPHECLPEPGCSRVSREFNHRDELVNPSDVITVSGLTKDSLNHVIQNCVQNSEMGTIQYSAQSSTSPLNTLTHSIFVSSFFGFIDDMYLQTVDCQNNQSKFSIEVQSVLRIGQSDLGVNPQRVASMYTCIANGVQGSAVTSTGKVCA